MSKMADLADLARYAQFGVVCFEWGYPQFEGFYI